LPGIEVNVSQVELAECNCQFEPDRAGSNDRNRVSFRGVHGDG